MKIYFSVLLITMSFGLYAQKQVDILYSETKVKDLAKEVFLNESSYQTKEHLVIYKDYLQRVEIIDITGNSAMLNGNYKLISTLSLTDKYNPDLDYDKGPDFDINKFNPLKYSFETDNTGASEYYRIYQTNYLVRLLP